MTTVSKAYAFVLVPGYSQLGFSCALEALSLANRYPTGGPFYRWRLLSETGAPVPAYNGVTVSVDGPLAPLERDETLIVCAGEDVGKNVSKKLISWLRNEVRRGMDFGALSSGTYVLALAGLLSGKRVTTHWEYRAALTEILPDVIIEDAIFTVDGRIFTTAGGAASMDMMLDRIRTEHGPQLATWVADQMVYTDPRLANHAQRIKLQARASALLQEHSDVVLFANYRISVSKSDVGFNKKVTRALGSGARVMHTEERPAFLAKNRYGLPETLPLEWSEFLAAMPQSA